MSYSGMYRNVNKLSELIVLVFFCSLSCSAQDLIIRNGGADTIKCVIIEDKITFLSYRLFNSNDTNLYIIMTSDYEQYYRNKTIEYFNISTSDTNDIITNSENSIEDIINIKRQKGGYQTFYEFKSNKPSVVFDFEVRKRSDFAIAMMGGNDYKIISKDGKVTGSMINKEFWAICDDSCCYINCHMEYGHKFYSLIIYKEDYAYFTALPPPGDLDNYTVGFMFGAVGGAVAGASESQQRVLYKLDLETGKISIFY